MAFLRDLFRRKKERVWKPKDKTTIETERVVSANDTVRDAKTGGADARRGSLTGTLLHTHVTEKAAGLGAENKYVFVVRDDSDKKEVKRAVESRYAVRVQGVNLIRLPAKFRRRGRQTGWKPGLKKAIITFKEGQKVEIQ